MAEYDDKDYYDNVKEEHAKVRRGGNKFPDKQIKRYIDSRIERLTDKLIDWPQ